MNDRWQDLLLSQGSVDGVLSWDQSQGPVVGGGWWEIEETAAVKPLVVFNLRSHNLEKKKRKLRFVNFYQTIF